VSVHAYVHQYMNVGAPPEQRMQVSLQLEHTPSKRQHWSEYDHPAVLLSFAAVHDHDCVHETQIPVLVHVCECVHVRVFLVVTRLISIQTGTLICSIFDNQEIVILPKDIQFIEHP